MATDVLGVIKGRCLPNIYLACCDPRLNWNRLRFYAAFDYEFNEDTVKLLHICNLKIYKVKTGVFTDQTALYPNLASEYACCANAGGVKH